MNSEKYAVIQELPANQILIIDIYGNVQVYSESHVPKLNDIAIVNDKISKTFDVNLINGDNQDINNFDINLINQDNEKVNINDDVAAIFEAIEQGGDINSIFEENPTAAGNEAGSSLTSTGTISRSGAELLASTYFETSGLESLGLSTTQFLSLFQTLTELDALPFPIVATPIITDVDQTLPDILNNEPIGDDSSSITNEDTPISGSLVASDPDEDDLTYTIITNTENGSLDLDENGNWTYTPNEDYDGNDNAIIQVSDGNGGTDTINLSLTVRPIPEMSITGTERIDEDQDAVYIISFDKASDQDTQLRLSVLEDSATFDDLGAVTIIINGEALSLPENGIITLPEGETEIEVHIPAILDELLENTESFSVNVEPIFGLVGGGSVSTDIIDSSALPFLSVTGDESVNEGDYAFYDVSLSKEINGDATVQLEIQFNTAEHNDLETFEYKDNNGNWIDIPENGEITITAGQTNVEVRIKTTGDDIFEDQESFVLIARSIENVEGNGDVVTTIFDDGTFIDDDRPTVSITGSDSIDEGDYAFYTVSIDKTSDIDSTVVLNVNHGSTEINDIETLQYQNSNGDWVDIPNNGEIIIAAGDTDISLRIKSTPDNIYEGEESFSISVEGKDHVLGNDTQTTSIFDDGSISDDDRPTVSISGDESISESSTAYYVVSLDAASELDSTVRLSLDLVTAESDDIEYFQYKNNEGDWVDVPENGEVNILAGQTDIDVRVKSTQDDVYEGEESFVVSVVGLGHVLGFDSQETSIFDDGSIDDDDRPIISIVGGGEVNEGDYALFTLNVTGEYKQDAVVKLSINNIETNALDISSFEYKDSNGNWMVIPVSGLLTLAANTDMVELRVKTTSDNVFEEDELFNVSVESISGITGNDSADATIIEPNTPPIAFDINMDVYGSEQVPFADYVSDYEDDHDPNDIVSIRIESEPEYGILYYMDEDGIQQVLTEGSIVKESDIIQYFFDPTTIDPNSGFNAGNYEGNINGESSIDIGDFTISGGTFNHLDGNPTFTQAGEITFDQAAGERGFGIDVLNGNGDRKELGLDEYMSIKFDNTYVSQFTLLVGSINGLFNSEAGHIEAYFYKDGVLLSSEGTPLEVTERVDGHIKEGDVFVENEEAFDEVRFVVVNDSNDGRGLDFVIQGVEDFNSAYPDGIEDRFTYTAIDTEGLESETATVTITNQDVDLDYEPVSNFIGLMQETDAIYLGDFDEVAINQEENTEGSESSFSNMSISLTDILDMGEEYLDAYLSLAIRSEDLELTITDAPKVIETSNTDPSIEYQNTLIDSVSGLSSPSMEMFDDLLKTTVHDS